MNFKVYIVSFLSQSAAAATTISLICVSLAYRDFITIVIWSISSWLSIRFIYGVLFVSDSDATFIITQIIHASIDIIIDHLTCL